jgi:hypothetical protein
MYLAGELNKSNVQPPSMSPESLASKYVSYFGLHRDKVASGMDERSARQLAQEEIMPLATDHFLKMQAEGLIAQDYIKIDPDDPSNDIRVTGHKVSARDKVQKALSEYRAAKQSAESPE